MKYFVIFVLFLIAISINEVHAVMSYSEFQEFCKETENMRLDLMPVEQRMLAHFCDFLDLGLSEKYWNWIGVDLDWKNFVQNVSNEYAQQIPLFVEKGLEDSLVVDTSISGRDSFPPPMFVYISFYYDEDNKTKRFGEKYIVNIFGEFSKAKDHRLPPLKLFNTGYYLDEIQCKQNLVLIQKYDGTPACVTESTKQKLVERGWTSTMVLNDNQKEIGSYLKQVEILDENYVRMSMSYPTNDANHEIYPDDYQSIVSGCTEQNNTATLSLLYLQKIDTIQNQMMFRQENKTFDGLQCDEALWQEMIEWGYCGPPHPLIFNTESLASSIIEAQNKTDLMLDLPQYLPSGYSIQKITVEPDGESAMLYISQKPVTNEMSACEFTWNDEGVFLFYYKPSENFDWNTKYVKYAEDPKKQLVTINGNSGYVEDHWVGDRFGMPIPQQSKVVWYINVNDEIIEIHSSLSGEELIKIAESLQ
ncbi:hypothetical protein YTPLAS73_13200 [Nitrosarchaeum sp.]|nr:hypothetical protein YTPLAS73_13200 [Nitrosarchaeum sp.]